MYAAQRQAVRSKLDPASVSPIGDVRPPTESIDELTRRLCCRFSPRRLFQCQSRINKPVLQQKTIIARHADWLRRALAFSSSAARREPAEFVRSNEKRQCFEAGKTAAVSEKPKRLLKNAALLQRESNSIG